MITTARTVGRASNGFVTSATVTRSWSVDCAISPWSVCCHVLVEYGHQQGVDNNQ